GAVVPADDGGGGVGEFVQAEAEDPADDDEAEGGGGGPARVALPEDVDEQAEDDGEAADDAPVYAAQDDGGRRGRGLAAGLLEQAPALFSAEHGWSPYGMVGPRHRGAGVGAPTLGRRDWDVDGTSQW